MVLFGSSGSWHASRSGFSIKMMIGTMMLSVNLSGVKLVAIPAGKLCLSPAGWLHRGLPVAPCASLLQADSIPQTALTFCQQHHDQNIRCGW